jgi:tetratricopeptide (TPR) repeat protein
LRVMEILPDSTPDRMQLAGLLITKGAHAEALKHLDASPDASLDVSAIRRRRVCLEALGRVREAQEAALGAIALVPDSVSDMVHLANLYFKTADTDRAVAWLDRAIAVSPDNVSLFRRKRNYLEAAGRISEAIDAAACVQKLLPSSKVDQLRLRKLQLRRYHEQGKRSRTAVVARIRAQSAVASRALVETEQFALFPTLLSSAMNVIAGEEIGVWDASVLLLGLA